MKITDYTLTWQESQLDLWTPFEVLHVQVIAGNGAVLSILEFDPHEGSKRTRTRYNFFIALSGEELPRQMRHVGSDVNYGFHAIHVFMELAR